MVKFIITTVIVIIIISYYIKIRDSKKIGEQRQYTSTPVLGKHKSATTKFQPSKIKKLSDIATNILTEVDEQEGQDEGEGIQQNEIEGEIDQEIREEIGEQIPVQGQEIENQDEQDEITIPNIKCMFEAKKYFENALIDIDNSEDFSLLSMVIYLLLTGQVYPQSLISSSFRSR